MLTTILIITKLHLHSAKFIVSLFKYKINADDLSSDLTNSPMGEKLACKVLYLHNAKLVTFHHHQADWLHSQSVSIGTQVHSRPQLELYQSQINPNRPKMEYSCHIWAGCLILFFPASTEFKVLYVALWLMDYFPPYKPLQQIQHCYLITIIHEKCSG